MSRTRLPGPPGLRNADAISRHAPPSTRIFSFPQPPPLVPASAAAPCGDSQPAATPPSLDNNIISWFSANVRAFSSLREALLDAHLARAHALVAQREAALSVVWWPFTQHQGLRAASLSVIDSRWGDSVVLHERLPASAPAAAASSRQPEVDAAAAGAPQAEAAPGTALGAEWVLRPSADAAASWWTQGVGAPLAPRLARAAGYAAARWGHVMFPENAHEPAVRLAKARFPNNACTATGREVAGVVCSCRS